MDWFELLELLARRLDEQLAQTEPADKSSDRQN